MFKNTFYAIRHGETDWNRQGLFQGSRDIPLIETGRRQARDNALKLQEYIENDPAGAKPFCAYSSPLSRCTETLEIIRPIIGLSESACATDLRLREAGFGKWEGLTTYQVKERFRDERRQRKHDRWNFAPDGGRSYADLEDAMREFLGEMQGREPILIVAHTGNLRVMLRILQGMPEPEAQRFLIPHDKILIWRGGRLLAV